jgi:hypothetical protein
MRRGSSGGWLRFLATGFFPKSVSQGAAIKRFFLFGNRIRMNAEIAYVPLQSR